MYNILLVDDDPFILKTLGPALELEGYNTSTASDGKDAIELLNKQHFDLVITDLMMAEVDGIDVLKTAKKSKGNTMVIILTGFGDMTSAIDALRLKADDYLLKPCEPEELFFRVSNCLEKLEDKKKIKTYEKALREQSLSKEEISVLLTGTSPEE